MRPTWEVVALLSGSLGFPVCKVATMIVFASDQFLQTLDVKTDIAQKPQTPWSLLEMWVCRLVESLRERGNGAVISVGSGSWVERLAASGPLCSKQNIPPY